MQAVDEEDAEKKKKKSDKTSTTVKLDSNITVEELLNFLKTENKSEKEEDKKDDKKDEKKEDKKDDKQKTALVFEAGDKQQVEKYLKVKVKDLLNSVSLGSFNHGVVDITVDRDGVKMTTRSEAENIVTGMLQRQLDVLGKLGVENKKIVVNSCSEKTKEMIIKFCKDKGVECEFVDQPQANQKPAVSKPAASIQFGNKSS